MKALVLTAPSQFEMRDVPEPTVGADEVLIAVRACGICGSDVQGMDGRTGRRQPPLVMGHEAAGVIVRTGQRVRTWSVGDRVTFDSTIYCGTCVACAEGRVNLCENRRVIGVSCAEYRMDGAFAQYIAVPERVVHRLPDTMTFEAAAFVEPTAVALHAVNRLKLPLHANVVVVGAGLIGLLVVQALKLRGAKTVVAVDINESRLSLAERVGADVVLPADGDTPFAVRRAVACDDGADAAFEVVGLEASLRTAVESVRKGGAIVCVGNLAPDVKFPLQLLVTRELSAIGTYGAAGEFPAAIEAIANGQIDVSGLLSAVAPLEDGPNWFARLGSRREQLLKVVLTP